MLLNNTITPTIIWHQAMSYLSVPIPTSSTLNDVTKLPKYLSKSAFYDNFIYFRHGSKTFITIQITDKNTDGLGLECFDIFTSHRLILDLKTLHSKVYEIYSCCNIFRLIKLRTKWMGHVA